MKIETLLNIGDEINYPIFGEGDTVIATYKGVVTTINIMAIHPDQPVIEYTISLYDHDEDYKYKRLSESSIKPYLSIMLKR